MPLRRITMELTALDSAAEHGRLDMVQILLNAGACGDFNEVAPVQSGN